MAITQDSHKQGLIWQSSTGQMRYSDKNQNDQWIQQIPYYPIAEDIKYGNLVTIREDGKLHLTDSRIDEICVGIALEPGKFKSSQLTYIHVQPFGKFTYRRKDNQTGNDNISETLYNATNDYDPLFKVEDIGKYAYAKYSKPGEIFVGNDETLQQNQSLIRVGIVASLTELDILIYNSKDRGNVDRADVYMELGENVTIFEGFPKVFAIGNDSDQYLSFSIVRRKDKYGATLPKTSDFYIFMCNKDGKGFKLGYTTPNKLTQKDEDLNFMVHSCKNISYYSTSALFSGTASFTTKATELGVTLTQKTTKEGSVTTSYTFTSNKAGGPYYIFLSDTFKEYFDLQVNSYGSSENKGKAILADIRIPSRRNVFGFYDLTNVDWKEENGVKFITLNKGVKYPFLRSGTISLKTFDEYYKWRDYFNKDPAELSQIESKTSEAGDNVGSPLYLGTMGNLIKTPHVKYGYIDPVATYLGIPNNEEGKDREHKLLVDCKAPSIFFNDSIPVAYLRKCPVYEAEAKKIYLPDYGHLVASGKNAIYTKEKENEAEVQKYLIATYSSLYNKLQETYYVETDGDYFYIPEVTDSHGNFMEFNYVDRGIFSSPRIEQPYLRRYGTFTLDTTKAEVSADTATLKKNGNNFNFDITELVNYGVFENSKAAPQLDSFDIHLYIDLNNKRFNALGYFGADKPSHWVEVYPGYYNYNNNQAYGYTWRIITSEGSDYIDPNEKDGYNNTRYYLTTFIGDNDAEKGKGICYVASTNEAPYTLEGVDFKVTIARKDNLPRQFDLQCFIDEFEGRLSAFASDALSDAVKAQIEKDIKVKLLSETNEMAGSVLEAKIEEFGIAEKIETIIQNKDIPNRVELILDKYSDSTTPEYTYIKNKLENSLSAVVNSAKKEIKDDYDSTKINLNDFSISVMKQYIESKGITEDYLNEIVKIAIDSENIPKKVNDAFLELDFDVKAQSAILNSAVSVLNAQYSSKTSPVYIATEIQIEKITNEKSKTLLTDALNLINIINDIDSDTQFKKSISEYLQYQVTQLTKGEIENSDISGKIQAAIGKAENNYRGGLLETAINGFGIRQLIDNYIDADAPNRILLSWNSYWGTLESPGSLQTKVIQVVDDRFSTTFTESKQELLTEFSTDKTELYNLKEQYISAISAKYNSSMSDFDSSATLSISDLNKLIFSTEKRNESNAVVKRRNLAVQPDEFLGGVNAIEAHRASALSAIQSASNENKNFLYSLSGYSAEELNKTSIKSKFTAEYDDKIQKFKTLVGIDDLDENESLASALVELYDECESNLKSLTGIYTPGKSLIDSLRESYTSFYNNLNSLYTLTQNNISSTNALLQNSTLNLQQISNYESRIDDYKIEISDKESKINNYLNDAKALKDDYDLSISQKVDPLISKVDTITKNETELLQMSSSVTTFYNRIFLPDNNNEVFKDTLESAVSFLNDKYTEISRKIEENATSQSAIENKINIFNSEKSTTAQNAKDAKAAAESAASHKDSAESFKTASQTAAANAAESQEVVENILAQLQEEGYENLLNDVKALKGSISADFSNTFNGLIETSAKHTSDISTINKTLGTHKSEIDTLNEYFDSISGPLTFKNDYLVYIDTLKNTQFLTQHSNFIGFVSEKENFEIQVYLSTEAGDIFTEEYTTSGIKFKHDSNYADLYANKFISTSLSKYKRIYGERGLDRYSNWSDLTLGSIKYRENNEYANDYNGLLGSALQAAYEMPLAYWQYNSDHESDKKTLGIIVERLKDITKDNSLLKNEKEVEYGKSIATTRNIFKIYDGEKPNKRDSETILISENADNKYISKTQNEFVYTEKEVNSIKEYIRTITNTDENGENIVASVGFLFAAAKETQERLLQLEASTFGFDAKTIPGDKETRYKNVIENPSIIPVDVLCNDPTSLGLNRLIRALCDEIYQTSNPMTAADFTIKDNPDSTVSRIDMLDESFHGMQNYTNSKARKPSEYYLKDINSKTYPYLINKQPNGNWNKNVKTLEKPNGEIVSESGIQENQFNGVIDALGRISTKVNQLTIDIHGADNIDLKNDTTLLCNFTFSLDA